MSAVFDFTFVPWFRSVAPYIHMHRGKTFVVGIAGEAIAAGKLPNLAQDLALIQSMGVRIVLVHGFRPQVNEQLAAKGHVPQYSHGMRITDGVALDCAQEAAGQLRFEIEAAFSQALPNTPMAGSTVRVISGNFITARPVGIVDGVDFQHSGLVRKVDVDGIMRTLDMGAMVLLSPFGFSPTGEAFNLTMEEVATSVAIELQADKLIYLTEVRGIPLDPGDPDSDIDQELALADAKSDLGGIVRGHGLSRKALEAAIRGQKAEVDAQAAQASATNSAAITNAPCASHRTSPPVTTCTSARSTTSGRWRARRTIFPPCARTWRRRWT